jgi:hypothetical protein
MIQPVIGYSVTVSKKIKIAKILKAYMSTFGFQDGGTVWRSAPHRSTPVCANPKS